MKWTRIRPGLYRQFDDDGEEIAVVEHGAETGLWWWADHMFGDTGYAKTLKRAKGKADGSL